MKLVLEQSGLWIGGLLLFVVTACAFFLAFQAARNVERFREEDHERFVRPDHR